MSFSSSSKRSPSPFSTGSDSNESSEPQRQNQDLRQQRSDKSLNLLAPKPIQATSPASHLRRPSFNSYGESTNAEKGRGRRDSYLVVHDNLLLQQFQQQPEPQFPASILGEEESEELLNNIEEIRSAIETPIQRLNNSKNLQLDNDALAELVVSVRDLSKSLSMYCKKKFLFKFNANWCFVCSGLFYEAENEKHYGYFEIGRSWGYWTYPRLGYLAN